jgi:hypothetical protein
MMLVAPGFFRKVSMRAASIFILPHQITKLRGSPACAEDDGLLECPWVATKESFWCRARSAFSSENKLRPA